MFNFVGQDDDSLTLGKDMLRENIKECGGVTVPVGYSCKWGRV